MRSCRGGEPPIEVIPATQASTVVVGISAAVVVWAVVSSALVETSVVASLLVVSSVESSAESVAVPSEDDSRVGKVVEAMFKIVVDSVSSDVSSAVVETSVVSSLLIVFTVLPSADSVVVPSDDAPKVTKVVEVRSEIVVESASSDDDDPGIETTEDSEVESSASSDVVEATSSMLDGVSEDVITPDWSVVSPRLEVDGSKASEERLVASSDTTLLS